MKKAVMKKAVMKKAVMKKAVMKKAAMKKAAMKKVMKAKKVSKIARGKYAKSAVFNGYKEKTGGGLTSATLAKNKRGRVVSKKASAWAKKNFANSALKKWSDAAKQARKALGSKGFVPVGGKTPAGKALYAKVKLILGKK